ncbi:hypothetical protein NDU88_004373 [Pleurodeles waltl]|uniref:Uncharacterized protein n=1 Tax=Pleurodeles waltl TaxID=8319 RepID=A0AAV7M663_PLEWA|nr:hypothetical protein NDU88_004373 [Pleurodeles waltl]
MSAAGPLPFQGVSSAGVGSQAWASTPVIPDCTISRCHPEASPGVVADEVGAQGRESRPPESVGQEGA